MKVQLKAKTPICQPASIPGMKTVRLKNVPTNSKEPKMRVEKAPAKKKETEQQKKAREEKERKEIKKALAAMEREQKKKEKEEKKKEREEKKKEKEEQKKAREEANKYWAVKKILDERLTPRGYEYLIEWEDNDETGESYAYSWRPARSVTRDLIREWDSIKPVAPKKEAGKKSA